MGTKTGISWTDATWQCSRCRQVQPVEAFARDRSRPFGHTYVCKTCRNAQGRQLYTPRGAPQRYGPLPALPRPGDKRQARRRVNVLVRTGKLRAPNELPCADCGHLYQPGDRRHEYDHYLGYGESHHLAVQPVCIICHHKRELSRGH